MKHNSNKLPAASSRSILYIFWLKKIFKFKSLVIIWTTFLRFSFDLSVHMQMYTFILQLLLCWCWSCHAGSCCQFYDATSPEMPIRFFLQRLTTRRHASQIENYSTGFKRSCSFYRLGLMLNSECNHVAQDTPRIWNSTPPILH